jgi:hypothetical protein
MSNRRSQFCNEQFQTYNQIVVKVGRRVVKWPAVKSPNIQDHNTEGETRWPAKEPNLRPKQNPK